jgi:hypothetical protein
VSDLVLVPGSLRQARAARRLCDAQGGLLLGPRVVLPRALVPGLLAAAGEPRRWLTPLAERLLALSAARDAGMVSADPAGGAARAAIDLVAELRRGEVSARAAWDAAGRLSGRPAERLAAAAAALEAYESRLDALPALDGPAALRAAAAAVRRGAASEETRGLGLLVLEGYHEPAPGLVDLVAALAGQARAVLARIPYLPDRPDGCGPVEPWLRRLESLHEAASRREIAVAFPGTEGPRGERVARALGVPPGCGGPAGRVVALGAPGDEEQAEAAARLVAEIVERGLAAEEVAVVAPRRLAPPLSRAFAAAGIPFAPGAPVPLASLPVVRALRAALGAAGGLERSAVEALLRGPCLRLGDAPERLGRHLERAGAIDGRGDPEAALRRRAASLTAPGASTRRERDDLLRAADAVAALRAALAPLQGPARPREWAARLRAFAERAGARRRAARAEGELARRDLSALTRWEETVDDLAAALALVGRGEEQVARAELAALLDLALQSAALPPPGEAAAAVEAWSPEEAPGITARAALVLGCEPGAWPRGPRADPLLGDAARSELNRALGRRALATSAARQAESEFLGLSALAVGSEVLAVGWTRGPGGGGPEPLAAEALARAGVEAPAAASDPPLGGARSSAEALRAAARLARAGRAAEATRALVAAGPELLARWESALARGELERERRSAWLERRASPGAGAVPLELALAWDRTLPDEWSPTQLETFARCPYRFFLQAAGVPDEEGADLEMGPRDEGSLLHAVLEAFLRARRARGAWPLRADEADREELLRAAEETFAAFAAQGRVGDPSAWRADRAAVRARLLRWLQAEAREDGGLVPALLEFRFGGSSGRPPVVVPDRGREIRLKGRVDRVDADADRLLVLDYKNARHGPEQRERLAPEALGATSFQVPAYLLAAARELPGRRDLAASFVFLRSAERAEPWRTSPGDGFLALDEERREEVRAAGGRTFADGVADAVGRIRRGELPVASRDCTGCPYGAVCRFPLPGGDA